MQNIINNITGINNHNICITIGLLCTSFLKHAQQRNTHINSKYKNYMQFKALTNKNLQNS